jgi:RHS repeat-associated protein
VGNRTGEVEKDLADVVLSDKVASFDALNRLESLTDSVAPTNNTTFTYDSNGNQTSKTQGGVTTEYRYDTRDKLVEVQQSGAAAPAGRFQYDFEGRRSKKIGEERFPGHDGVVQYVYDHTSTFLELDGAGQEIARYDYGSDRLLSLTHRNEGRRYFHLDGLRSVVNLTDDTGAAQTAYHLSAWGEYRNPLELDASTNRFGFTGHYFDRETGLYFARARYLSADLGRFISQDSYLGEASRPPSLHRYFYANANPLRYVDPTGRAGEAAFLLAYGQFYEYAKAKVREYFSLGTSGPPSEFGSSGVRLQADKPRAEYRNPVARQRAESGQLKLAEIAEAGHGCAYCHIVKEHKTYAEAEAALDLSRYNRVATALKATTVSLEAALNYAAFRAFAGAPLPEEGVSPGQNATVLRESPHGNGKAPVPTEKPPSPTEPVGETAVPPAGPSPTAAPTPNSGVVCGSGGPCKVYEIPAEELTAGKPYIGKTKRDIPQRMADRDHRLKTPTGKPPQAKPLAENLTPEEAAGVEALLAQERGLENLSNKIPPLDPKLPKNTARIEAGQKVLDNARNPE